MFQLGVLRTLLRECFTTERSVRVPEPKLIMDDPEQVRAYTRAGREDSIMAPTFLFHCAQMCEIIRSGETVLDLACGPATQLGLVARLNPETHFIGLDFSAEMLDKARAYVEELDLNNVELCHGNMTDLRDFDDNSVDVVVSTMSLHHLPDVEHLEATFAEIRRILKPSGGLYLADFAHLKSEKSIHFVANQHHNRQPALFTVDYLNSLRAAFYLKDLQRLTADYLASYGRLFAMYPVPLMVAIKSPIRSGNKSHLTQELQNLREKLPAPEKANLRDMLKLFSMGGLRSDLLI